jgi:hypothetical protein
LSWSTGTSPAPASPIMRKNEKHHRPNLYPGRPCLTEYLKERFSQEKIYLVGESWGSALGIFPGRRYPESYHAFIGTGQMVDLPRPSGWITRRLWKSPRPKVIRYSLKTFGKRRTALLRKGCYLEKRSVPKLPQRLYGGQSRNTQSWLQHPAGFFLPSTGCWIKSTFSGALSTPSTMCTNSFMRSIAEGLYQTGCACLFLPGTA